MNKKIFCDNKFEDFCLSLNIKSNQILKKKNPITYSCTATASLYFFSVLRISKNRDEKKERKERDERGRAKQERGRKQKEKERERENEFRLTYYSIHTNAIKRYTIHHLYDMHLIFNSGGCCE